MIQRCECNTDTVDNGNPEDYDETTERPYRLHKAGECKCTNKLKQYETGKGIKTLCSCCCMPWHKEVK